MVELVYAPEYRGGIHRCLLMLAAGAGVRFTYLPVGVAATAMRRIGIQLVVRGLTLLAVIALVAAGARWRGLEGAALALLGAGVAEGLVWLAIALGSIRQPRCSSPQLARGRLVAMCSIFGLMTPRWAVDPAACASGLTSLRHRGPDGFGVAAGRLDDCSLEFSADSMTCPDGADVYLGHVRLAIVDLSLAALQPMTNETRDVWVVFNGEIYNHAELRTVLRGRGHQFRTHHSDTEVLVPVSRNGAVAVSP